VTSLQPIYNWLFISCLVFGHAPLCPVPIFAHSIHGV